MAIISEKKHFQNGTVINTDDLNDIVDTVIDGQTKVNKLLETPDSTSANNVGVPTVTISNGKFKFSNLKGEKGDKGDTGSVEIDTNFIVSRWLWADGDLLYENCLSFLRAIVEKVSSEEDNQLPLYVLCVQGQGTEYNLLPLSYGYVGGNSSYLEFCNGSMKVATNGTYNSTTGKYDFDDGVVYDLKEVDYYYQYDSNTAISFYRRGLMLYTNNYHGDNNFVDFKNYLLNIGSKLSSPPNATDVLRFGANCNGTFYYSSTKYTALKVLGYGTNMYIAGINASGTAIMQTIPFTSYKTFYSTIRY